VGSIVAGLGLAVGAVLWFGPDVKAVQIGATAPDFKVYDLRTQDSVSFRRHYKGAVTLVNVWATYCIPCSRDACDAGPLRLAERQGFRIAAVSVDVVGPQEVRQFADDLHLTFDILQDRDGRIQQDYQTTGVPESFLVNKKGVIVKRLIGAQDWNSPVNRALVTRLLAESPDS
jgi:peroxiredoxin